MVKYTLESDITNEQNLICAFTERMDTAKCNEIQEELFEKVKEASVPVIFNLQGVEYVSSLFLGICLKAAKETGLENFSIINVHPNVKKVFKIAGFDKQISIN